MLFFWLIWKCNFSFKLEVLMKANFRDVVTGSVPCLCNHLVTQTWFLDTLLMRNNLKKKCQVPIRDLLLLFGKVILTLWKLLIYLRILVIISTLCLSYLTSDNLHAPSHRKRWKDRGKWLAKRGDVNYSFALKCLTFNVTVTVWDKIPYILAEGGKSRVYLALRPTAAITSILLVFYQPWPNQLSTCLTSWDTLFQCPLLGLCWFARQWGSAWYFLKRLRVHTKRTVVIQVVIELSSIDNFRVVIQIFQRWSSSGVT